MPKFKIFCVTRDEYDLIEDFIVFYAHLFGFENVHIIDNNSCHPHVLEVYRKYIPCGLHVVYESNYQNTGQGEAFTKHMQLWKNDCDFLIGLDTDEFMFCNTPSSQPSQFVSRTDIDALFDSIPSDVTKLFISSYLESVPDPSHPAYKGQQIQYPARNIVTFKTTQPTKIFYRSNAFISTGCGNHWGETTNNVTQTIPIGLYHYHACGQYRNFERARNVMDGYKYLSVEAPLRTQIDILNNSIRYIQFGIHRAQQYQTFLLRAFLVELFVQYCKRLPSLDELEQHVEAKKSMTTDSIELEFKHCKEAQSSSVVSLTTLPTEDQKRSILYYDHPISSSLFTHTAIRETLLLAPYVS